MPNTKITKAKKSSYCPLCDGEVLDNQWRVHLLSCNGGKFPCQTYGKLFKKHSYLQRHEKKFHDRSGEAPKQRDEEEGNCSEEWLEQDPGDLIGGVSSSSRENSSDSSDDESLGASNPDEKEKATTIESKAPNQKEENPLDAKAAEKGRIIRKSTTPAPVFVPQRKTPISLPEKASVVDRCKVRTNCCASTQTESLNYERQRLVKKRKLHKIVSSYVSNDKKVEETTEEEEFTYTD